jgi:hypothetical protein
MTFQDRCAFCGTHEGLTSVTRLEAAGIERVERVCSLCLRLAERAAHLVPMTRHDMLAIRWMADHREQPGARYHGQPIVGYSEWKTKDSSSGGTGAPCLCSLTANIWSWLRRSSDATNAPFFCVESRAARRSSVFASARATCWSLD